MKRRYHAGSGRVCCSHQSPRGLKPAFLQLAEGFALGDPVMLMSMAVWVQPRTRVLALAVFVLIVLQGCASVTLTPQRERVVLKTSTATRYYPVRALTATAIFDDIDKNGLFDNGGRPALGQASVEWKMDSQGIEVRGGLCEQPSMTITLNIVVTLRSEEHTSELQSLRHLV